MTGERRREPPPLPEPLPAAVVDAHTHLDACGYRTADEVRAGLDRAASVGVHRVVTVADDLPAARWAAEAATWDERVFAAVGLHPTRTASFSDADRAELERLASGTRVVAVGETGLDYYWTRVSPDGSPKPAQLEAFRWHIDLAKRLGKALVVHDREAHDDVLAVLEREGAPPTVVLHCFSGDAAMARRCVDAGYLLSFAGTVSFRNARALHEAGALVPAEQLLVETDAPFLTPHPHRGRANDPYCLPWTVRALAELRRQEPAEVAAAATGTAQRAYRLPAVDE